MKGSVFVLAALLGLSASQATGQGFAGLGSAAEGHALPDPRDRPDFPDDHASHDLFRIEWWYLTANLTSPSGEEMGAQFTLFRNALATGGLPQDQAWMGHAAVSTSQGHFHDERLARGGTGQAGVTGTPFAAWIDEWSVAGDDLSDVNVFAQGSDFAYDLRFLSDGPFILNGDDGYSVKSAEGLASHYYSQPFYSVSGTVTLPSGRFDVEGEGWLDREWSSQPLTETQTGWDWMSLHLDGGEKMMLYRLRDSDADAYVVGTYVTAERETIPIRAGEARLTPTTTAEVAGRDIPVRWSVEWETRGIALNIEAIYPDSWMPTLVPYWEGPVRVSGSHTGRGYLEMTGYD